MGQILTKADLMMCPHGGQVTISALQTSVKAGAEVLRASDSFVVACCALASAPTPKPCVKVEWQMPANRVKAGQPDAAAAVLTTDSIGLCKGADQATQGSVLIQKTQQKVSAR